MNAEKFKFAGIEFNCDSAEFNIVEKKYESIIIARVSYCYDDYKTLKNCFDRKRRAGYLISKDLVYYLDMELRQIKIDIHNESLKLYLEGELRL